MNFRLASRVDASALGKIHYHASLIQPDGFMHKLGERFLIKYYEILLDSGSAIAICATDDDGVIDGFVVGTFDAASRIPALKQKRLNLFLAAIKNLALHPGLILEVIKRQKSDSNPSARYVITSGAHLDFWAWRTVNSKGYSFIVLLKWLSLAKLFNISEVFGEVDLANDLILKGHLIMGAKIVETFTTPDGRRRCIICYNPK